MEMVMVMEMNVMEVVVMIRIAGTLRLYLSHSFACMDIGLV